MKYTLLLLFWASMLRVTFPEYMYEGGELNPITVTEISLETDFVLHHLTMLVNAEAWGEPNIGKKEIQGVIMARVLHRKFPSTIMKVIYQKGQFDGIGSKYFKYTESTYQLVKKWYLEKYVSDYLFFHNPCTSTDSKHLRWVARKYPNTYFIQNHIFHGKQ
jgi:spore germination cell wall hydrolase CwlJ-like protein